MLYKNKSNTLVKILVLSMLFFIICIPSAFVKAYTTSDVHVVYNGHVQDIGWMGSVSDGQTCGTQGRSLRLEDLKIGLSNALPGMYVTYQAHIQNIGWKDMVQDMQDAGTVGKALRMEAVKIQLHNASSYHIQYRVHVQNKGWMDWVQDGAMAGTTGQSLRIEAIQIKIVRDDNLQNNYNTIYQSDVQDIGWQNWVTDADISGTTGQNLRLEKIKISIQNLQAGMNIKYQAHVQNIGWMDWVQNGQEAGYSGGGLRIEALKVVLEGMPGYHVQYQAHVQYKGWMPWAQDGEIAGTTGQGLRVEALRVRIVKDQSGTVLPKNVISQPTDNATFYNNQNLVLNGYALNKFGNSEINVYLDGALLGKAAMGLDSSNVNSSGYVNGTKSGYSYTVPLQYVSDGSHTITVQAIGSDMALSNQSYNFTVKVLNPGICIDTPKNATVYKNGDTQLSIAGWSLNAFGVQRVQIYVDGQYKCDANIGLPRADVNSSFPNYINGANSGYSKNIDMTSIANGVHTVTVYSVGNDGVTTGVGIKIYKFYNDGACITSYNLSLQQMVDKQMSDGEPVADVNGNWVTANRSSVQYYVDPLNFIDSYGIYQFLRLDYIQGIRADDLNNILSGKGVLDGKGAVFLAAAQQSNINPVYLVAHAMLETGNGTSALAKGIDVNGTKVYNMFGIHAYDSNANYYGSQYAYSQGWDSVDKAILGGAKWISGWYINNSLYKQNTLYKMRWNPTSPADHQYATDIRWAYNQVYNIKRLMDKCQNANLQFDIPQYK